MENYKTIEGEIGFDITLEDMQGAENFLINTYGGDLYTGWAGYDYMQSLENPEIGVMGVCASSGTIILLGASNRWGSVNSKFCLHNPFTMASGDAETLQKIADDLQKEQNRLVALYEEHLTISKEEIEELMQADKMIDANKALEIGLIIEIREDDFKPVEGKNAKAIFFNLKRVKMSKENQVTKEELNQELEGFFAKVVNKIKGLIKPVNVLIKDVEGKELEFSVDSAEEIEVGVTATVDGAAASGEYTMSDGTVYVFEGGTLTEIKEPEPDEMEALKTENEELKAELESLKSTQAEQQTEIQAKTEALEEIRAEVEGFKNVFSKKINNSVDPAKDDEPKPKTRRAFKQKE